MKPAQHISGLLLITCSLISAVFMQSAPVLGKDAPVINGSQAAEAYENEDYSWKPAISGGTPPYTCNSTGPLPSWLTLDKTSCTVYGKPPRGLLTDTASFTIRVIDSSSPPSYTDTNIVVPLRYKSTISVKPAVSDLQTAVYVDGQGSDKIIGSTKIVKVFFSGSKHTISIDPKVQNTNNTVRYTTDLTGITVSGLSPDAAFEYIPEYNIRIKSNVADLPPLSGSGWYKTGSTVESTALPTYEPTPGIQYRFTYWQLPSGEVSGNQNLNLKVSKEGDVVATYDTYYQLNFVTEYCTVNGGGWYKAGSTARWNVSCSQSVPVPGFWGGLGVELKPDKSAGTTVMDGSREITITWKADSNRIIIQITFAILGAIICIVVGLLHQQIKDLIDRIRNRGI